MKVVFLMSVLFYVLYFAESSENHNSNQKTTNLKLLSRVRKGAYSGTGRKPWWTNKKRLKKTLYAQNPGQSTRFPCPVDGSPEPQVEWFKDGKLIRANDRTNLYKFRHNNQTMILKALTLSDAGMYKCEATNIHGSISITYELQLFDRTPATIPRLALGLPANITADIGEDVEFICKVLNKPFHVQWLHYFNGTTKYLQSSRSDQNTGTNYLHLVNITEEDAGSYSCIAANYVGYVRQSAWLIVLSGKPRWNGENEMQKSVSSKEGNFLELKCLIQNSSYPYNVTWFKNGESIGDLDHVEGYQYSMNGQILQFSTLFLSDEGIYTCLVSNEIGFINHTFNLTIEERVTPWWPSFITVVEGEDVQLRCSIYDKIHPLFIWTKGDNDAAGISFPVIDSSATEYIQDVLSIRNATQQDSGQYTCITGGDFQDLSHQSFWIRVIPAQLRYKAYNNTETV